MSTSIGKVPTRTRPPRSPAASARRCGRAALPRLPQATGPPGHFDPRPGPVRRRPGHRADAHRAGQRPAGRLRLPRCPRHPTL